MRVCLCQIVIALSPIRVHFVGTSGMADSVDWLML